MKDGRVAPKIAKAVMARNDKRMRDAWGWEVDSPVPLDLIKAGDAVVVGLDEAIVAYDADSGRELWRTRVDGAVHGLAVANGMLFASTDLGHIHAFAKSR